MIFLADKVGKEPNDSEYLRVRHVALWSAAELCYLWDHAGICLSEEASARLQYAGSLHVLAFAWLYEKTPGLMLYQPLPKWHYFEHAISRGHQWRINPMVWACWDDEKYLSRVKSLGKRCHGGTMLMRSLQRYILMLSIRWDKRRSEV